MSHYIFLFSSFQVILQTSPRTLPTRQVPGVPRPSQSPVLPLHSALQVPPYFTDTSSSAGLSEGDVLAPGEPGEGRRRAGAGVGGSPAGRGEGREPGAGRARAGGTLSPSLPKSYFSFHEFSSQRRRASRNQWDIVQS